MHKRRVIGIYGPTAVGKTELVLDLSRVLRQRGWEPLVVSADAFAVYRELKIISGAPSHDQLAAVKHEMIGVCSVTDTFSAGRYVERAHRLIDEAVAEGRVPIVAGGTGLYLNAATRDMGLRPPVDGEIRERLAARLAAEGADALHRDLMRRSPDTAARIDPADGRRITRALELIDAGLTPADHAEGIWDSPPRHSTLFVSLSRDRGALRQRIEARCAAMLASGARDEALSVSRIGPSSTAAKAIGYNEMLEGDVSRMQTRTWQYARRQMAWMRRSRWDLELQLDGQTTTDASRQIIAAFEA